jgi:hypothetical protein
MSILPLNSILGRLEILEVYEFYDKPCLFSCRNMAEQIYLAIWVDETATSDSWIYASVSVERLEQILAGSIELRDSFVKAEDDFVFEIFIDKDSSDSNVTRIRCSDLTDDKLPNVGEFLNITSEATIFSLKKKIAHRTANKLRKPILNIAFSFPGLNTMQAPTMALGNLLHSTQYLIDALGQFKAGEPTVKGSIANKITRATQLDVIGTFAGSFGIEMTSAAQPDLWGDSLAEDAMETFLELISAGDDSEELRNLLLKIKPRAVSRYCVFLKRLIDSKVSFIAEWGSFNSGKGSTAEMHLADAKRILNIVTQVEEEVPQEYNIEGELVGVNKRTKYFEIWDVKNKDKKYSGRILDSAISQAETATLSEVYTATLREIVEVSPNTGAEKPKYQLVCLVQKSLKKSNRK